MSLSEEIPFENIRSENESDEQIFFDFLNFVKRNFKIIFATTSIFFLIFISYSLFLQKRLWEGQFQIVLTNNKNSFGNRNLLSFTGQRTDNLKTEVIILKSPSVLKSVFDFVKEEKSKKDKKFENWKFTDWANKSLIVGLEKGTDVLNFAYQDNDKSLILPVLEKITVAYKKYRGDSHKESMLRTLNFLEEQKEIYRIKTIESLNKLQRYGLENNLSTISLKELDANESVDQILHLNIEIKRDDAVEDLTEINRQIRDLQMLTNTPYKFIIYADEIDILSSLKLSEKLLKIENSIANDKKLFTEKDPSLILSLKKRQEFFDENIKRVFEILEVKKISLKSIIENTNRGEGILENYKKLISNYLLNNKTLTDIASERIQLQVEIEKEPNPWKLITQPRLLDYPIGIGKKTIVLIGSSLGLLLGIFTSYIYEFKKRIIYDGSSIRKLTNSEKIIDLEIENIEDLENSLIILSQGILNFPKGTKVLLIYNEKISGKYLNSLRKAFTKTFNNINLVFSTNVVESKDSEKIILLTSLGYESIDNVKKINNDLKLMKKAFDGWINIIYPSL